MIDQIFADIMKEARSRKGKDIVINTYTILMELGARLLVTLDQIVDEQRRKEKDENKTRNS